jgi:hypothetical protein
MRKLTTGEGGQVETTREKVIWVLVSDSVGNLDTRNCGGCGSVSDPGSIMIVAVRTESGSEAVACLRSLKVIQVCGYVTCI